MARAGYRMAATLVFAVAASMVFMVGVASGGRSIYSVTPIADFNGPGARTCGAPLPHGSAANSLNDRGQVVGWAAYYCDDGSVRAFLFRNHDLLPFPFFGTGYNSAGVGINNAGQIAIFTTTLPGFSLFSTRPRAILDDNGVFVDAGVLFCPTATPPDDTYTRAFARGLNGAGDMVGWSDSDQSGCFSPPHAFVFSGGILSDLGTLGGAASRAYAINDHGQIVGESNPAGTSDSHAFLYGQGLMRDLGTLGGRNSAALAISASGDVVGSSERTDGSTHAFLYSHGAMHDLGTLGGTSSIARGINRWGQIVGLSQTSTGDWHAFLVTGGRMIDLNTLATGNPGPLLEANSINNTGQIAGSYATRPSAASSADWPFGFADNNTFAYVTVSNDAAPPTCTFRSSGTLPAGESFVRYTIGDEDSGLAQALLENSANALLSYTFSAGTTSLQVVTVIRQRTDLPWSFTVRISDIAGNSVVCPH